MLIHMYIYCLTFTQPIPITLGSWNSEFMVHLVSNVFQSRSLFLLAIYIYMVYVIGCEVIWRSRNCFGINFNSFSVLFPLGLFQLDSLRASGCGKQLPHLEVSNLLKVTPPFIWGKRVFLKHRQLTCPKPTPVARVSSLFECFLVYLFSCHHFFRIQGSYSEYRYLMGL